MAGRASVRHLSVAASAVAVLALAIPLAAQSPDELDTLVQASAKPADGLALARSQAGAGAWLEALTTLERVLAGNPKHKQARLLHASILCRIDDPDGARLEFGRLKSGDYKKAEWSAARSPCEALAGAGT